MSKALTSTLAALTCVACGVGTLSGPDNDVRPFGDAEVKVLFIGNSLTAANDLPALVGRIADAAGRSFEYRTLLRPNYSLEDHWYTGADAVVRELEPDVVVFQQGPSSVEPNPLHLRRWTATFAPIVEQAGGRAALLMVWPERSRMEAFDAVRESYRSAAEVVDGLFIPAGESWRAVWERDAGIDLYGPDGFHPSRTGSFVAALTVFEVLFEEDVRDLPVLEVGSSVAPMLYDAVHAAVQEHALTPPGEGVGSGALR
jgi:hypothetical protein